jgi:hypothetical protein
MVQATVPKCSGICETGPEQLGLDYAPYLLGMQTAATLATQVLWKWSCPYYGFWGGDNWRITPIEGALVSPFDCS